MPLSNLWINSTRCLKKLNSLQVFSQITAKLFTHTINYKVLIKELDLYWFHVRNVKWLESYLSNSKQFINFDNREPNMKISKLKFPQGWILRFLIFSVIVNDVYTSGSYLDNFSLTKKIQKSLSEAKSNEFKLFNEYFLANEHVFKLKFSSKTGLHNQCHCQMKLRPYVYQKTSFEAINS